MKISKISLSALIATSLITFNSNAAYIALIPNTLTTQQLCVSADWFEAMDSYLIAPTSFNAETCSFTGGGLTVSNGFYSPNPSPKSSTLNQINFLSETMVNVNFDGITSTNPYLYFTGSNYAMETLSFNGLTSLNQLQAENIASLKSISLNKLETAGDLMLNNNVNLTTLSLPNLRSVSSIHITNTGINDISFLSQLTSGTINVNSTTVVKPASTTPFCAGVRAGTITVFPSNQVWDAETGTMVYDYCN